MAKGIGVATGPKGGKAAFPFQSKVKAGAPVAVKAPPKAPPLASPRAPKAPSGFGAASGPPAPAAIGAAGAGPAGMPPGYNKGGMVKKAKR